MKNKVKCSFILLTVIVVFSGCNKNKDLQYNNEPYKYIVISSFCDTKTNMIKIGMNNNVIQSNQSKKNAITMGSYMKKPQKENNKIYYAASASFDRNLDYGILSINPKTLSIESVAGLKAATSFYVDDKNVYTAGGSPVESILVKSKITDLQKNSDKFLSVNLKGHICHIYEDGGYIYTIAAENPEIMMDALTVTKIDKETLKSLDKFIIKDSLDCTNVLTTETDIFFVTDMSTESTNNRKPEKYDGYQTGEKEEDLSEIYRFNKKTKEMSVINLPFANAQYVSSVDGYLYCVSGHSQNGEFSSFAKINILTNKIEKAINLPYLCYESYVTDDMFISLDGYNIYEYDLKTMKLLNTIKLTDNKSERYTTFVLGDK